MVLSLAGPEPGELAPPELEMLSQNLMGTLLRLARERDVAAQVGAIRGMEAQVEEWKDHPRCVWEIGLEAQVWGWNWRSWASRATRTRFSLWCLGADVWGIGWVTSDLSPLPSPSGWLNCC